MTEFGKYRFIDVGDKLILHMDFITEKREAVCRQEFYSHVEVWKAGTRFCEGCAAPCPDIKIRQKNMRKK